MDVPSITLLQRSSQLLGDLCRRIGQVPHKLPIRTGKQEDENDVHKEVKVISKKTKSIS